MANAIEPAQSRNGVLARHVLSLAAMNERIGALALLLFGPLAFAAGCRSQAIDRTAQQEFDEIDRDVENNVRLAVVPGWIQAGARLRAHRQSNGC